MRSMLVWCVLFSMSSSCLASVRLLPPRPRRLFRAPPTFLVNPAHQARQKTGLQPPMRARISKPLAPSSTTAFTRERTSQRF
jgi:hypothetical protein